ncbi:MAG: glycosyltransferase [Alloprevotella sp.]|nr:glycosyltransferase [Alloprevotella sp.]
MKLLSIIIPSYNQGCFIEETFQSVISQMTDEVEILVFDGGSTDNSVELIKKYASSFAYWQSQKDGGQSNAINQGFLRATGKYVTWLNSDDVLLNGALDHIISSIKSHPEVDWFLGNVLWLNKTGNVIRVGKVEQESHFWNKRFLFSNGGPSAILNRNKLIELGALREDFHYMMDTELWLRLIKNGVFFKRINSYLWGLRLHENAKMSGHNFAESSLADKNHPSWIQKRQENQFLEDNYHIGKTEKTIWRLTKIVDPIIYSRYFDRKLLGRHYMDIDHSLL